MRYTLVIIDAQPYFSGTVKILEGCREEIKTAIALQNPIVIVELGDKYYGTTDQSLLDLLANYTECTIRVQKFIDDGSSFVFAAIEGKNWPADHMRICGVNASACVKATVVGLKKLLPNSRLVAVLKAIADSSETKPVNEIVEKYGIEIDNSTLVV